eukprot:NODE_1682_length_1334_cov_7.878599_g1396_i0.p1 GENE.NODE_1682_length_1334_cov_7.878599_g1396_i0~~NODE_1682_length_1334_cov_7.878599_g1396_i0.p1  ORF type:complete len:396 (+),score=101.27 NODE_1682_length_1334_cov_7.878599_g1396_i0:63-1250(+)
MVERSDTIVVDGGSGFIKCGFSGANMPTSTFPSMVGRPLLRAREKIGSLEIKDIMVGQECADARAFLDVNTPIRDGVITNWEDMQILWNHAFYDKLKIDPKDCRIMLTEPPANSMKNRAKEIEIMFEHYGFRSVFTAISALLALYAQGNMTGLVLDCGHGVTHALPVAEGYLLNTGVKRMNLGGSDITNLLITLLGRRGYAFNRSADYDTVRQIKEKFCYVAEDLNFEKRLALETTVLEKSYTLPDGRTLQIGSERFEAPEALFRPELLEKEGDGLAQIVYNCVQACPIDLRAELYKNTVLSGGSTMFPGLPTRLERDITDTFVQHALKGDRARLASSKWKLFVQDSPSRKQMVFLGGAVLADLTRQSDDHWMMKSEYEEMGVQKLLQKFPLATQ